MATFDNRVIDVGSGSEVSQQIRKKAAEKFLVELYFSAWLMSRGGGAALVAASSFSPSTDAPTATAGTHTASKVVYVLSAGTAPYTGTWTVTVTVGSGASQEIKVVDIPVEIY